MGHRLLVIGESLAAARKGQRLALSDAERLTCLRARYLSALEDERFDLLPGRAYARAFLRTYASALGLIADDFVDEFDRRFPEEPDESPAPAPVIAPRRRIRLRPGFALASAAVAAIAGLLVWSATSKTGSSPSAKLPTARAAPPAKVVQHRAPAPPAPAAAPHRSPLVVHAKEGPCWLLVRRGGASGPVMYEGTLQPGATIRFAARVWVRLGAPWNVAVHRGSHTVHGLSATTPINLVA
jgi:hypothetical protein